MARIYYFFGILLCAYYTISKPNGSPKDSCFYMTPRHIHPHTYRKVFPTKPMGLYNITTSADVFRPDRPIRGNILFISVDYWSNRHCVRHSFAENWTLLIKTFTKAYIHSYRFQMNDTKRQRNFIHIFNMVVYCLTYLVLLFVIGHI